MPVNNLTYASPESLGIPSQAIINFLEDMQTYRIPLHSYLVLRHGKVAAEGYCAPFDADTKHRMYSISKSFTSVAIGMLITEGRLSLTDKVAEIIGMEKSLANAMKTMLGINPSVHLVAPKTIARSEGKAVRVVDKRKLI